MKVRYIGWSSDGVVIADTGQYVKHGEEADVSDELGASLIEQHSWERVAPVKAAKAEKE